MSMNWATRFWIDHQIIRTSECSSEFMSTYSLNQIQFNLIIINKKIWSTFLNQRWGRHPSRWTNGIFIYVKRKLYLNLYSFVKHMFSPFFYFKNRLFIVSGREKVTWFFRKNIFVGLLCNLRRDENLCVL